MFGTVNRNAMKSNAMKSNAMNGTFVARPVVILLALVLGHMAVTWAVQAYYGLHPANGVLGMLLSRFGLFLPIFFIIVLMLHSVQITLSPETGPVSHRMSHYMRSYFADKAALGESLLCLILLLFFTYNFNSYKSIIPFINPFQWDQALTSLDLALHGGIDPWQIMWPLLQSESFIRALDIAYFVWFLIVYFAVFTAIFGRGQTQHRRALLIATVLAWGLGGNFLATIFSSAGPVFYENLGLGTHFSALTQHLDQIHAAKPLLAFQAADMIWQGYAHGGDIAGISAFPSMHMASITLVTCFGFAYARWLGWVLAAFCGLIFVGSVGLAWHYAVDGYAGIAIAYLSWRAGQSIAARA